MSRVKTVLTSIFFLSLTPSSGFAVSGTPADPAPFFAACAGRFSAMTDISYLYAPWETARTERTLKNFETLIAASSNPMDQPSLMATRIEEKVAFKKLLSQRYFNTDKQAKDWLNRRVAQLTQECTDILMPS